MKAHEFINEDIFLDEGILDRIKEMVEKSKDKFFQLKDALSKDVGGIGKMWKIIEKGTKATDQEIDFANKQFKNLLRSLGLINWYTVPLAFGWIIPAQTPMVVVLEKVLNKVGLSIVPRNFKDIIFNRVRECVFIKENFADGKNPGRKGLSKRVGIPRKASLSALAKIAKNSTGERRRMAQWQLNMRRGKSKKNK